MITKLFINREERFVCEPQKQDDGSIIFRIVDSRNSNSTYLEGRISAETGGVFFGDEGYPRFKIGEGHLGDGGVIDISGGMCDSRILEEFANDIAVGDERMTIRREDGVKLKSMLFNQGERTSS